MTDSFTVALFAVQERRGDGELSTVCYSNKITELLKLMLNRSSCAIFRTAHAHVCAAEDYALTHSARPLPRKAQHLVTLFWERN